MIKLESTSGVGGSLAPISSRELATNPRMSKIKDEDHSKIYGWWQDLESDFQRLNDNATDYIASLRVVAGANEHPGIFNIMILSLSI